MRTSDFLPDLEQQLGLRAVPFSRADALEFVAGAWPLICEDPDPVRWAGAFLDGRAAADVRDAARAEG